MGAEKWGRTKLLHQSYGKFNFDFYRPSTKLWEGNVFTGVCLSTGPWSQVLFGGQSIPGARSFPAGRVYLGGGG